MRSLQRLESAVSFENHGFSDAPVRERIGKKWFRIARSYNANAPWQCIACTSKKSFACISTSSWILLRPFVRGSRVVPDEAHPHVVTQHAGQPRFNPA